MKSTIEEHLTSGAHLSKKHVHPKLQKMFDLGGFTAVFKRGDGQYLYDMEDNQFLDLLSGGGVHFVGRNHPRVNEALRDVVSLDIPNLAIVNASILGGIVAERLKKLAGEHIGKVMFANSGSEATDVALRVARYVTKRRRFLYLEGAFHGRTWGAISVNGWAAMKEGMDPMLPVCTPIPANNLPVLRRELQRGDVAGLIMEPVQGMTLEVLEPGYMREARSLCREYGTVFIADEVQTGFGRCGHWFLTREYGVEPDIITVSKTISGGQVPVSAVLVSDVLYNELYKKFTSGPFYFSTFAENNLAMAASLATMDVLEEMDAPTRARELSDLFRSRLADLAEKHDVIERIGGKGLMLGVFFKESEQLFMKVQQRFMNAADKSSFGAAVNVDMFKRRVIVQVPGPGLNAIKILPPVCCTDEDVETFIDALDQTLSGFYAEGPALTFGRSAARSFLKTFKGALPGARKEPITGRPAPANVGGLLEFHHYTGAIDESCDFLVVGSGPAGAMVARHLALPGKKAIMVEEGPVARTRDFKLDAGLTLARYCYDGGLRIARGNPVLPTLQCKVLGGGSVFNSAICLPPTASALERWERNNGVEGMTRGGLDRWIRQAWDFMGVRPTPRELMGPRDLLFFKGAEALGWKAEPISRNEDNCKGSAQCLTGCPNNGKLSTDRRGIPEFIADGGRVYTSFRVDRLIMEGNTVKGVEGWIVEPFTGKKVYPARIRAKTVVLSAGAIGSPAIMQRSGIRRRAVGANLCMHPGTCVLPIFEQDVLPWSGASQGVQCLDFLEEGIKLETAWCSTELMSFRFPGLGEPLKELLADFRKMAVWAAWVGGLDSNGAVRTLPGGQLDISFQIGPGDTRRLAEAMAKLSELSFAAGATGVISGIHGVPRILKSLDEAMMFRRQSFVADQFPTASNHVFGGNCMGADPKLHATDSNGKVYETEGLFVCDTGLFPDSAGVNPMFTAMVLAERQGEYLAAMYA